MHFADADKFYGNIEFISESDDNPPFCRTVQLLSARYRKICRSTEFLRLRYGIFPVAASSTRSASLWPLPETPVDNLVHFFQLQHQISFILKTAGRIADQDVDIFRLR